MRILASSGEPRSVSELASELGVGRTIVYRLLQTLDDKGLLAERQPDGKVVLGLGLLTWARHVDAHVREAVTPYLRKLAEESSGTAFLGVLEGDEVVCLASAEPSNTIIAARYREGIRRPVTLGATGAAIRHITDGIELSNGEFAVSREEVERGSSAIAAPIRALQSPASIAIIFPNPEAEIAFHGQLLLQVRDDFEQAVRRAGATF